MGPQLVAADELSSFAQKIQKTYESTQDLSMDFTQRTYVAVLEKEVSKKGVALFKKPGKFSIHYEGPQGRNYLSNGKKLWIYETGDSQVQESPVNDDTLPSEALSFLGGLGNLTRDFAVEEVDPKKVTQLKLDMSNLRWMELTPLKKRSSLDSLVMGFEKGNGVAREIYLFTDSGNLSHYQIEKVQFNPGLNDSEFEYKKSK